MYESFYGLTSKPFQLNPDPAFYFGSKQHKRATAYLEYGLHQNQGFIVVTGEVGAGKTTIVRNMLEKMRASGVIAAQLVSTQMDADDTLRLVGAAFGVRTAEASKAVVLMTLEAFFTQAASEGKRCLLIVDEAQNLTPKAVEELRMLSNFQFGNRSLLQTFLVGQPEFREILQSPSMLQLRQRVIATCHISPMEREETQAYIEHRLKCAGATDSPSFDAAAYDLIHEASNGLPRRINALCDRALLFGFLEGKKHLGGADVREVIKEIEAESSLPARRRAAETATQADDLQPGNPLAAMETELAGLEAMGLDEAANAITALNTDHFNERLQRLERGMLRLERANTTMLVLLQKLLLEVRQNRKGEMGGD